MKRISTHLRLGAGGIILLALALRLGGVGHTESAFSSGSSNENNLFAAAADWVAPTAGSAVIAKTAGGAGGTIKPNATYRVYASIADSGNPASGVASATANVSAITAGTSAAALTAGVYTVNGVSFNYRSGSLTAGALANGSYAYTLTLTDALTHTRTQSGFSVAVDATAPSAADIQPLNKTVGVVGKAEIGDTIAYTFSEPMDPNAFQAGWTGNTQSVIVRLNNVGGGDQVVVYNAANSATVGLGTVSLANTAYTTANRTFGLTGTASTMVMSGNTITVTLGTASGATGTVAANATASWTPVNTATDVAGNAMSTTARSETGAADANF